MMNGNARTIQELEESGKVSFSPTPVVGSRKDRGRTSDKDETICDQLGANTITKPKNREAIKAGPLRDISTAI